MASTCAMRSLGWILGKIPSLQGGQAVAQAAQGSARVTIHGVVLKCGHGIVFGKQLDLILEHFSNLNDSLIL